jgi:hypothetical protein
MLDLFKIRQLDGVMEKLSGCIKVLSQCSQNPNLSREVIEPLSECFGTVESVVHQVIQENYEVDCSPHPASNDGTAVCNYIDDE